MCEIIQTPVYLFDTQPRKSEEKEAQEANARP
jgi:hypothetical protein